MAGRLLVVGLGPGDPGLISVSTRAAIAATPVRFLRTTRHPSAHVVGEARSFDDRYETAAHLEDVYAGIAAALIEAAAHDDVVYAVPGSPLVAERTVEILRGLGPGAGVDVEVWPAVSFLDLAWVRLGVDPLAAGVRLVDGQRFATEAAGSTGPLLVGQCDAPVVLSDIKLSVDGDPAAVVVLQRLGLPDEAVFEVAWEDLDRAVVADHLTSIWIPRLGSPVAAETARLVELTRDLRARCSWDRVQTHQSLRRHLLEEAYEVLDAIEELPAAGGWEHLEEELGDLLFQITFHAQLAGEEGQFGLADVARGIHDKLVARHPHLFAGDTTADSSEGSWEERKQREKGRTSVVDGIPRSLPALARAEKLQRRAAGLGLDWPDAGAVWPVVDAELAELRAAVGDAAAGRSSAGEVESELGDVLFSVVNLARKLAVDAELALRAAGERFARRVGAVERLAGEAGLAPGELGALAPEELDALWQRAKAIAGA